ncbi:PAAR-like protein [Chitinophaga sancti]|uniref:PAAR-like protein n=1 Tax=Chitinophaga sancti TaxID=1004 RepID=UPI002A75011A|nr:PAAR-like protein [Chitinophaga sancti]WPQ60623.1 PAAR-like protein [Chitinophaga sancti]
MSEKHFVVQGATCKCDYGASPDKLKISSNDRDYINDGSGDAKPIASTKDIGQPLEAKTFGRCNKVNSACNVNITKWDSFYNKITLTNGGKILTEDSKATCAVSGNPCITIINHGQVAQVTSAHFDNVEVSTMAALNPMAAPPDNKLQIPKVKSIEGKVAAAGTAVQSGKKVPELVTRVDEDVTFKVKEYFNPGNADKAKVSWKVFKGFGFSETGTLVFETIGPDFKMNFDAVGSYRVMAYGADAKGDPTCSIDVTVAVNKLKNEFSMDGLLGHFVKDQYRVRRGMNVTVSAVYEIDPPTAEEKQLVSMQVTDMAGNVIASGADKVTFKVDNSAATYIVTAKMGEQVVTKEMKSEANGVVAVTNNQNTTVIRPRTTMTFQVSKMTYTTQPEDFEVGQIKWQLNGRDVGTGKSITLDGNQYFTNPGNYVVEAYVSVADAWNAKKNAPAASDQADDWRFEVALNTITDIKEENNTKNWIVGKKYNVVATTRMPYDASKDGPFTWSPALGKGDKISGVYAAQKGKSSVTATLGASTKTLEVNADFAKIDAWYFGDKEGNYKAKAGWNEALKMIIKSANAANEEVELHILEANKHSAPNYIAGPKKGRFDANGVLSIDVNTNDLKSKLSELWFEGDEYDVFFVMLPTQSGLQFDGVKKVTCNGKEYIFPAKESNMRGSETGKYVYISKRPEVVDVKYFESGGNLAYRVYQYGEKIDIKIQTRNLAGKELTIEFWDNRYKLPDEKMKVEKKIKPDNTELVTLQLDTNELKHASKARNDGYSAFYLVIKSAEAKTFMYPKEVTDDGQHFPNQVYFFQHLKMSDAHAGEWSQLADKNAPAVLKNEPAQTAPTTTGCPNCADKVTADQLKKIFPQAKADDLTAIAANYTKYMKELGMDTCWNKAHFFAQVRGESGPGLDITEDENFNYWYVRLSRFKAFRTAEGKKKAKELGRQTEENVNGLDEEGEKKVANYAYGPTTDKGIELGNTEEGDGWKFRGMGPLQLTGRGNYKAANIYTKKEGGDIETTPELLRTDAKISLLASMAFWKIYKIPHVANKQKNEDVISVIVGADQSLPGGKTAYGVKKEAFKNTAEVFKVNECKYGETVPEKDCNRYKIDVDNFTVTYEYKNLASKQYRYEVIVDKKPVYTKYINSEEMKSTFRGNKVDIRLLPFPETGPNWGRFGTRDKGGDNYASPEMAAHLLGFFFCLPVKGYADTLYYNDISANDARNIGHSSHRVGVDVDIRYPGSPNTAGQVLWSQAAQAFPTTADFVAKLEFLLELATKWNYINNYTYKAGIKHSSGDYADVHQDHFHIGLKFSE